MVAPVACGSLDVHSYYADLRRRMDDDPDDERHHEVHGVQNAIEAVAISHPSNSFMSVSTSTPLPSAV